MAIGEQAAGALPRLPDADGGHARMDETQLRAALSDAGAEHGRLQSLVEQLREANQNLVLATVNAQTLRDEAEATNLRQNEFLAMLAHELRNPLAPISMAGAMLSRLPAPSTELLNLQTVINRQVKHLAHLLDDLLDAARISSGKINLLLRPIALDELFEHCVETVQLRMRERRQHFELLLPAEPIVIDGDQVRLAQAFSNLLVNASKFTQDGGLITLRASVEGEHVVVVLRDNGAGIAPDLLPHVFDLFTQGPRSLARSEGGLGVGLNVVRNIIDLHGGSVVAASAGIGCGSSFTVTLPASHKPAAPEAGTLRAPPARGHRILLVEDNVDASDTLRMFLEYEGHTVSVAYDGPTGLAMALSKKFDVLICDIGLPGIDGYELICNLRASEGASIPFAIAVSGYGQVEDQMRAISAGFGQYLVKPIDVDALLTLIASKAVTQLVNRR